MIRRNEARPVRSGRRFAPAVLLAGLVITGCTDWAGYDLDYIMGRTEVLATMRSTVSFEAQDIALLPPVGTVPVVGPGVGAPAPFGQAQLDSVGATLTNPLQPTAEVLARGEVVYDNQCMVCHGALGEGNGPVVGNGRFPIGPVLTNGAAAGRSDGYLYGVIRVGRGLMPAYGARIGHQDRWALVHYLRQLQGQPAGATTAAAAAQEPAEPAAMPAEPAPAPDQGQ